jgi:hypothetical protein
MDNSTMMVVVVIVLASVAIVAFLIYRLKAKVSIKGPMGTGVEIDASNEPVAPSAAVRVTDAKSRSGGLTARDETGRGVDVNKVEVERDITATSTPPKPDPKA